MYELALAINAGKFSQPYSYKVLTTIRLPLQVETLLEESKKARQEHENTLKAQRQQQRQQRVAAGLPVSRATTAAATAKVPAKEEAASEGDQQEGESLVRAAYCCNMDTHVGM